MRAFLALIYGCLSYTFIQGQSVKIDNKVTTVTLDSFHSRNSFSANHNSITDTSFIENMSLWIYAKNNGTDYLSIQNGINHNDFSNGIEGSSNSKFKIVHQVSKPEIRNHQYRYNSDNYIAPNGIKLWPGSLDTHIKSSFVDVNQNSKYEPNLGDYPFIRGDQCLLQLSTDNKDRSSSLPPLNIELAQYYFLFAKSGDPILDNSIGFRWVLKNNSTIHYDTVKAGIQFHGVLSQLNNNYIGTDVINNAMFVHQNNSGKNNFASVVLLNKSLTNSIYYKNEGLSANKNDIPTQDIHFINYLESKWKDGDTLKLGSTGLDGDSSILFVFPNTTLPGFSSWSEERVGNQGGDRNGILTTEFYNWEAGSYQVLEGAILFNEKIDSLEELYRKHSMLLNSYKQGGFTRTSPIKSRKKTIIFPNPVSQGNIFNISSVLQLNDISIYNMKGKLIFHSNAEGSNVQIRLPKTSEKLLLCHFKYKDHTSEVVKLNLH